VPNNSIQQENRRFFFFYVFPFFKINMSSPLVTRTALLCRASFAKPAVFSSVRFSSNLKDVQHLEVQPILSVENLSGAPGEEAHTK
jgi:hypothetical protein